MIIFNSPNKETRPLTSCSKLSSDPQGWTDTAEPSLPHILSGLGPGVRAHRHVQKPATVAFSLHREAV